MGDTGRRRGAHLILVGLPGAGKTTVGRLVARRLRRPFVDLDEWIAVRAGRPIPAIFEAEGEAGFRALEREATLEIARTNEDLILAPGGGWMAQPDLLVLLRPPGRIIHLDVTPATALARMGANASSRPLLRTADPLATLHGLHEARREAYAAADAVLDTETLSLHELVDQVIALAAAWDVGVG